MNSLQGKRWFIWALVIMLVAGVGLVTYILTSDNPIQDSAITLIHRPKSNQTSKTKAQTQSTSTQTQNK